MHTQLVVSMYRDTTSPPVRFDFVFVPGLGERCLGCFSFPPTLTPIEPVYDSDPVVLSGAALCRKCMMNMPNLPALRPYILDEWPDPILTAREVEDLWRMVRVEQILDMTAEAARDGARRTTFEEVEGALRTAQQAAFHKGVDRVRESA